MTSDKVSDIDSQLLLCKAAKEGNISVVEYLLDNGVGKNGALHCAAVWAADHGRFPTLVYLIEEH